MRKRKLLVITFINILLLSLVFPLVSSAEDSEVKLHKERKTNIQLIDEDTRFKLFTYDSGLHFEYPDAVRGIYVTGHSAGGSRFESLIDLINDTDLNSMVIDIKEDYGYLTFEPEEGSKFEDIGKKYINDPEEMMKDLEKNEIYPIARIVVFKDTVLAEKQPELSFTKNGKVWKNSGGDAFVNPFLKEVWEYNVEIAKMAAEMGFKEIQFDYVRFAEGFENKDTELDYGLGDYAESKLDNVKNRVEAVTDFVKYAREELSTYDVDVSVDIFGYAATIEETPGIGQNFSKISDNVDVISSMIYPSHWTSYFGIEFPDKEPYRLVKEYAKLENEILANLDEPPVSRPWLQDFSAPWLYTGATFEYGKAEVEAQIKALYEHGIEEYLLWNAGNTYTKDVDYMP